MAYVWDVYNTATGYAERVTTRGGAVSLPGGSYWGKGYAFNTNNGRFTITNTNTISSSSSISGAFYMTLEVNGSNLGKYTTNASMYALKNFGMYDGSEGYSYYCDSTAKHDSTTTTTKGTISTTATSDSASAYPQDAVSGSYWYTFRGAPSGISYPTNIEAGQAVQITWDAGTNPLYYRVERSTDGGTSWQVLSATVTATSFTDTTIAGDTSSPSVMYRVCTLGEMAVSDYSTGSEVNIPRCSVRIKINGAWVKGKATYRKENGAWVIIPMADEAATIGADTHRKVILLTS